MTRSWLERVASETAEQAVVRAVVVACRGSCPREVGAQMLVWRNRSEGTIGGGSLEHDVMLAARSMLDACAGGWLRDARDYHLGPDLNQCCGGAVTVLLERYGASERPGLMQLREGHVAAVTRPFQSGVPLVRSDVPEPRLRRHDDGADWFGEPTGQVTTPLVIYGAGHVAQALVHVLDGLPFAVTWIDVAEDRFPRSIPRSVCKVVCGEPAGLSASQVANTVHLVMTHSHELDEAIVAAVLKHGAFAYLGMIGSETKAARFRQRLGRAGFGADLVRRLVSPIGLAGLEGKVPAMIAVSVAADLLMRRFPR